MFEFSIKSSTKLKKLTVEFDNDEVVVNNTMDSNSYRELTKNSNSEKSVTDVLADRLASVTKPYESTKSTENNPSTSDDEDITKNRDPKVDQSFSSGQF